MFIILLFFTLVTNQLILNNDIIIKFSLFKNISTANSHGGAINFNNNQKFVLISYCLFENCQTISSSYNGGAISITSLYQNTNFSCFINCNCKYIGNALVSIIFSDKNNILNLNSFHFCGNNNCFFSTWNIAGGLCNFLNGNCSNLYTPNRESIGHFGGGPPNFCSFSLFCNSKGPTLYGPYTSSTSLHNNLCFFNNSVTNSLIYTWSGSHEFNNCTFILNNGLYCSRESSNSYFYLFNSLGDKPYSGYYTSLSGSIFNLINLNFYFDNNFCNLTILYSKKKYYFYSKKKIFNLLFILKLLNLK